MRYLILGCGWVGQSVADKWLADGHEVWASTTSVEKYHCLQDSGIFAFQYDFDTNDLPVEEMPATFDFILVSIPATNRHSVEVLKTRFEHVHTFLARLHYKKLIFLSSVGIYPDISARIDEASLEEGDLNEKLRLAERSMQLLSNAYVFRLGGLFGKNRIFAKYFENRVCTTGAQRANFVHLDDVMALLELAFRSSLRQPIYNLVAPEHPLKRDVVIASALKNSMALPKSFQNDESFQKVVLGASLQDELNYTFKYPSPLDF